MNYSKWVKTIIANDSTWAISAKRNSKYNYLSYKRYKLKSRLKQKSQENDSKLFSQ